MIKHEGKSSQMDHVIISAYGLFVIETKNYKGWIFGDESQKYWTQVIYKRKEKLYNPIWQNNGHIIALKEVLNDDEINYIPIIVFTKRATLKFDRNFKGKHVIYHNELLETINQYKQIQIPPDKVRFLNRKLQVLNNKDRQDKREHVEAIKREKQIRALKGKSGICPQCDGELIKRKGKHGEFMGCSNYPKCRYTKRLTEKITKKGSVI